MSQAPIAPIKLLVVEDDPADYLLLERLLRKSSLDFESRRVDNPAGLAEALAGSRWDVVLSDCKLPEYSVEEAMRAVRAVDPDIPFIMVSGTVGEEQAVDLLRQGANDFVSKANPARLVPAIERGLAEAENRRARRQAEAALRDRERLFSTLARLSPVVLFRTDGQGGLTFVNRRCAEIIGRPPEVCLGDGWLAGIHAEDRERLTAAWADSVRRGIGFRAEIRFSHADGTLVWAVCEATPEIDRSGGLAGFVGTLTDISEQKRVEIKLRQAANVFANTSEGILITDAETRIVDVNEALCAISGYSREELVGQTPRIFRSGGQSPEFYAAMWRSLREDGYWRGELWNRRKNGEIFAELLTISALRGVDGSVTQYVGVVSDITRIKAHERELEHLAHFDPLTQLPNRELLVERLNELLASTRRSGRVLALAYLDLDGFKPINENYGHATGDRLLLEVADRLRHCLRGADTVARLGGDEFVLLLGDLAGRDECVQTLQRVLDALAEPYVLDDFTHHMTASIGVTLVPPDDDAADTLLRNADHAMYAAKQEGRNCFHFFDAADEHRVRAELGARTRIEAALPAGEFVLYYQPKVDLYSGKVFGAEALIRWLHPEQGMVPPLQFLPLIESSDFSIRLGCWVLETAARQADEWHRQGIPLAVSVNVSGRHFQWPGCVDHVCEVLAALPELPAGSIELELLETAALEDMAWATRVIDCCRAHGVHFSLDDFGTGYSSLAYFKRLRVDTLKIDQSFVRDMLVDSEDRAIVAAVIDLTRAFGRQVIAEGVETAEHGRQLQRLGCTQVQGYGIARPMPAERIADWVRNFRLGNEWRIDAEVY